MPVSAKAKFIHLAPRKVRLVCELIKGLDVKEAESQLEYSPKRAALAVLKLLKSAMANAEHNFNMVKENLYISKIVVGEGPSLVRWQPRAFGRASPITKKTSHVTLILEEKVKGLKKKKAKKLEKKISPKEIEKAKAKMGAGYWQRKREERKRGFFGRRKIAEIGRRIFRRKAGA